MSNSRRSLILLASQPISNSVTIINNSPSVILKNNKKYRVIPNLPAVIEINKSHTYTNMFYGCTGLTSVDVSNLSTDGVAYIDNMFSRCFNLTKIDLSSWDVSSLLTASDMFTSCNRLHTIDLSFWKPRNTLLINNIFDTFNKCEKTIYMVGCNTDFIDVVKLLVPNNVNIILGTPTGNRRLQDTETTLNIDSYTYTVKYYEIEYSDPKNRTSDTFWVKSNTEYEVISVEEYPYTVRVKLNDNQWRPLTYTDNSLDGYTVLESDSNYHVNKGVSTMRIYFNDPNFRFKIMSGPEYIYVRVRTSVIDTSADLSNYLTFKYDTLEKWNRWVEAEYPNDGKMHFVDIIYDKTNGDFIYEPDRGFVALPILSRVKVTNNSESIQLYLNGDSENATEFEVTPNTPTAIPMSIAMTDASYMFLNCQGLTYADLSKLCSDIKSINYMFDNCKNLRQVNMSYDMTNTTSFNRTFRDCSALESIDLSKSYLRKILFSGAFARCTKLALVKLPEEPFDVTGIDYMFSGCSSLKSLDLSSMQISAKSFILVFNGCSSLEYLSIPNVNISKIASMANMFTKCNKLTTIKCTTAFRDWCWENQDTIVLPNALRQSGTGTWELVD